MVGPQQPKIRVLNLGFSYSKVNVLDGINFDVKEGEFVSIVGPSGCGKTTLLNIIAGTVTPTQGDVYQDGVKLAGLNRNVGYVYQKDVVLPWFSVEKNISLGMRFRRFNKAEIKRRTEELMQMAQMPLEWLSAYPYELSGGMKRRVGILMAIALKPEILLLDEPFYALDEQTKVNLHQELLRLWESVRGTWIMVTHDLGEAITLSDRVIIMSSRPARVKVSYNVEIDRPRDAIQIRSNDRYHQLYKELWGKLREELSENK